VKLQHKRFFSYLSLLFFAFLVISCSKTNEIPKNEIPMYGNVPRTPYEKKADDEFIQSELKLNGTKKIAFQKVFELGWHFFFKGDYAQAMRRFNQCWLLDPDEPRIFNAYGAIAEKQGKLTEAIYWYQKGADKGDPKAQYNIADSYFHGRGMKKSGKEAVKWYRLAAEQDLEWAQSMIGICYEYGLGVPRNTPEANKWYEQADSNGATDKEKSWRHKIDKDIPPEGGMMKE